MGHLPVYQFFGAYRRQSVTESNNLGRIPHIIPNPGITTKGVFFFANTFFTFCFERFDILILEFPLVNTLGSPLKSLFNMRAHFAVSVWIAAVSASSVSLDIRGTPCNPCANGSCLARNVALGEKILDTRYMELLDADFHLEREIEADEDEDDSDAEVGDYKLYDDLTITQTNPLTPTVDLRVNQRFDNPVLVLNSYILYGRLLFELQGAAGRGVVSSAYLQSDDLDEIDVVEIIGSDPTTFQTNYFVKGNTLNHERSVSHRGFVNEGFNRYSVEWTPKGIKWYINDVIVRSVDRVDTKEYVDKYGLPSSPMVLKFSVWVGGDKSNNPGTIEWAGGLTDYSQAPFTMSVRNIRMEDYSNGQSYMYGFKDNTQWVQLQSDGGSICGRMSEPQRQTTSAFLPVSEAPKGNGIPLEKMERPLQGQIPLVIVKEFSSNQQSSQPSDDDSLWFSRHQELGAAAFAPSGIKALAAVLCVLMYIA